MGQYAEAIKTMKSVIAYSKKQIEKGDTKHQTLSEEAEKDLKLFLSKIEDMTKTVLS